MKKFIHALTAASVIATSMFSYAGNESVQTVRLLPKEEVEKLYETIEGKGVEDIDRSKLTAAEKIQLRNAGMRAEDVLTRLRVLHALIDGDSQYFLSGRHNLTVLSLGAAATGGTVVYAQYVRDPKPNGLIARLKARKFSTVVPALTLGGLIVMGGFILFLESFSENQSLDRIFTEYRPFFESKDPSAGEQIKKIEQDLSVELLKAASEILQLAELAKQRK